MKRVREIIGLAVIVIIMTSLAYSQEAQPEPPKNAKEVIIKTSAVCDMCKTKIEKALKKTDGVYKGILDLKTKDATITYDSTKVDLAGLKSLISREGYDADEVPAEKRAYNKLPACCKKSDEK